jgi:hypothetical protein
MVDGARRVGRSPVIIRWATLALACAGALAVGCAGSGRGHGQEFPELDAAATMLTGSFSSADQAAQDDRFFDVRLHMTPIWTRRDDGRWFYVEQAMASAPERPYRQRVYRVHQPEAGIVISEVYTLPDPEKWVGQWNRPRKFSRLDPEDLTLREGCAITLRPDGMGGFIGSTDGDGCSSDLSGAAYTTSEVRLTSDVLESWDRGFDATGAQVWGAASGPYRFLRTHPE